MIFFGLGFLTGVFVVAVLWEEFKQLNSKQRTRKLDDWEVEMQELPAKIAEQMKGKQ